MEFIENPRHALRAPVRCEARVAMPGGGFWGSPTHDLGYAGCQLLATERLPAGTELDLLLVEERVPTPARVKGRVAWTAEHAPFYTGVAFTPESAEAARPFFDALLAAYPGLEAYAGCPSRVPLDAPLAPGPVPRVDPELTPGEAKVMAALGEGMTAQALRDKLGAGFVGLQGPLFALLGRHHVVLGSGNGSTATAWAPLIARALR
jgi:hypothetical protein